MNYNDFIKAWSDYIDIFGYEAYSPNNISGFCNAYAANDNEYMQMRLLLINMAKSKML